MGLSQGGVSEWFKERVWRTRGLLPARVRIPAPPHKLHTLITIW